MILALPAASAAGPAMSGKTAIVVSRQIRPFIEVLEGIRSVFKDIPGAAAETYFLDQMDEARQDQALAKFGDGGYRIFLAIGPEAAELLWNRLPAADGGKYIPSCAIRKKIFQHWIANSAACL